MNEQSTIKDRVRDTKPIDSALAQGRLEAAMEEPIYRDERHEVRVCDVIDLFQNAGMGVFITGGAPRDWLAGQSSKDIDLSVDRPIEDAHRLLRNAYAGIDTVRMSNERFGTLRWGDAASGGVDINILRSWKDIQNDDMWSTTFLARTDLIEDALMRDFSINAFYYDCREKKIIDPLGCGIADLHQKELRLITHRRVLQTSFRTTFRILQFLCRGYSATANVLEHLERYADHDVQGMGPRIHRWVPNHFGAGSEHMETFKRLIYAHARQPASIDALDSFFS
jgi:poly(A) polymerase